jgi:HK97 family phage major capsid protein
MTRAEMLALLAKAGITTAPTASDAEVKALFIAHVEKTAPTAGPPLEETIATVVAKVLSAREKEKPEVEPEPEPAPAPRVKATRNAPVLALVEQKGHRVEVRDGAEGTGLNFVRFIKAQAAAKLSGDGNSAVAVLKEWGYDHIAQAVERHTGQAKAAGIAMKALGQSLLAGGGALVPTEFSTEFIALLRNTSCVRRSGARTVPLSGTLQMPKATGAGTASYLAENAPITPSDQTVGMITFNERKLAALTVVSNDLIQNASISAEQFVLDDLRQVVALREDLAFLFGTGASDTPRGIESLMAAAQLYAATAVDPKVPTLAEIKRELGNMMKLLMEGNIPMTTIGWLFTPRTWAIMWNITDGNGNSVFQPELKGGTLMGYPFVVTNQIPNNLDATTDASRLILADFAQAIIAEAMAVQAEVFPNGVYESGGQVFSGVSRDQSVVRLITKHDFNVRYPTAFVNVKVRWGAP